MAEFLFHPEAQEEYEAAKDWYLTRSERAAMRFEAEVERILQLIGESPEAFALDEDGRRFALVRRFPYSVVYEMFGECVYVLAIAHASRLPGYWKRRT